jgi:hypothetical protein
MGYSQYWYTPKELDKNKFKEFVKDVKKIINYSQNDLGIKLANGISDIGSEPIVTSEKIVFNGSDEQPVGAWTTEEELIIPWPSPNASILDHNSDPTAEKTEGNWFAGTLVSQRTAPIDNLTGLGSGSYETFGIERIIKDKFTLESEEKGLCFNCCKTAYRPYDLIITAVLISLKHYFPECQIHSDGEDKDWLDGKFLCNNLLGYGLDFEIDE